jgi:hypothetical protein
MPAEIFNFEVDNCGLPVATKTETKEVCPIKTPTYRFSFSKGSALRKERARYYITKYTQMGKTRGECLILGNFFLATRTRQNLPDY